MKETIPFAVNFPFHYGNLCALTKINLFSKTNILTSQFSGATVSAGDEFKLMSDFNLVSFRATHNSYSGNFSGQRGPILQQLNSGVRLIELDLHTTDFQSVQDYQIGHDSPGDQVWKEDGNPTTIFFTDWITQIAQWVRVQIELNRKDPKVAKPAPIQLLLDLKDSLALPSAAAGNYAALNERLKSVFGDLLLTPAQLSGWPDVETLRGKVFAVLSNESDHREPYLIDRGINPAVSMNGENQIVEVHESQAGNNTLWYWTGQLSNGAITWKRHGRYGTGTTPAVALNNDGWIVEVHKSQNHDQLWYQVGKLTPDLDIVWQESKEFDDGILPSITFDEPNSLFLAEVHRSQSHDQNWKWDVSLNPANATLTFTGNEETNVPRFPTTESGEVSLYSLNSGIYGDYSDGILVYTGQINRALICYEQVAFVEYQDDDPDLIQRQARFAAADADGDEFLLGARLAGLVTRRWEFSQNSPELLPPNAYPATDDPYSSWYNAYCMKINTVS